MIEIGKKYEIINSVCGNNGKIVTVIGFKAKAGTIFYEFHGDLWIIDTIIPYNSGRKLDFIGEIFLKPIYDGDEKVTWESMKDIWIPDSLCV